MFTLDRVSLTTIGLGIGLVLSGCMSPTGETAESADDEAAVDETTAAIHEDANVNDEALEGSPGLPDQLQQDQLQPDQLQPSVTEEETMPAEGEEIVDSTKSAIFIGRGFGWGGLGRFGGLGWGVRRIGWGGVGWGGVPVGWGWGGVPVGGFVAGVPIGYGYGYGTGFVGTCGLYGCNRFFW